ncbi:hypothetical protein E2C01_069947 [Portunus trituberculatus]|uniref:Uncharacterized protein n=1 Tax=Portunus trituberculatus TaxID=210409 RepID=A0A5B7I291_PORTR|nr:hypothetical protein [Portunus trituberculatus]
MVPAGVGTVDFPSLINLSSPSSCLLSTFTPYKQPDGNGGARDHSNVGSGSVGSSASLRLRLDTIPIQLTFPAHSYRFGLGPDDIGRVKIVLSPATSFLELICLNVNITELVCL